MNDEYTHLPSLRHRWDPDSEESMTEARDELDQDHAQQSEPTHEMHMVKPNPFGEPERMTVRAFVAAKLIVLTFLPVRLAVGGEMVGVVREIPVGYRDLASYETFRERFEQHVASMRAMGWREADER